LGYAQGGREEKKMQVVVFGQGKGGVGKSTAAVNLGAALNGAAIIDLDEQRTADKWGERRRALGKSTPQVMDATIKSLPATLRELSAAGLRIAILDCPGRYSLILNDAIRLSDLVIVPSRPGYTDLEASGETIATAQRLLKPYYYLISAALPGPRPENTRSELESHGHRCVPVTLHHRVVYADAVVAGLGVTDPELLPNKAAPEITALANWLELVLQQRAST
jgi:chromosome partitioning protein